MKAIVLTVFILLTACAKEPSGPSVTAQEARVERATADLNREKQRLQTLRDSLVIKIGQNEQLGMTRKQAEAVEKSLIEVQATVVRAAETNLKHQQELLALMKTGHR
ncbi:TPA: hypothetical protein DCE37_00910 [Candidatus Latescibacteria bacterium]|nr:hypothetical protein [Candidatus Latescibacterota bacterium]|tara:strand:+ start:299 stop:619 length:321 start_codon:yes stop_codon:yes gene_type:complete